MAETGVGVGRWFKLREGRVEVWLHSVLEAPIGQVRIWPKLISTQMENLWIPSSSLSL